MCKKPRNPTLSPEPSDEEWSLVTEMLLSLRLSRSTAEYLSEKDKQY